jgi:nucleotide-binding universal stress UspA family protein
VAARIIVGVDGSAASRYALQWATEEAHRRGGSLEIVYVWHRPVANFIPMYGPSPREELEAAAFERAEATARQTAADILAAQGLGQSDHVPVEMIVAEGRPVPILLETAKGADLLVVGARGLGGFAEMLLGSVSQHVVSHAPCPVAVVRPTEKD